MTLEEVQNLCNAQKKALAWKDIMANKSDNVYAMIIYKHLFAEHFCSENDWGDIICRGREIHDIIQSYTFPDLIPIHLYEQLYKIIFRTKQYHFRDRRGMDIVAHAPDGHGETFTAARYIRSKWSMLAQRAPDKSVLMERIHHWCLVDFLNIIHPFENKNFLFISILLDFFLVEIHMLPIALKISLKRGDYCHLQGENGYNTFLDVISTIYAQYKY